MEEKNTHQNSEANNVETSLNLAVEQSAPTVENSVIKGEAEQIQKMVTRKRHIITVVSVFVLTVFLSVVVFGAVFVAYDINYNSFHQDDSGIVVSDNPALKKEAEKLNDVLSILKNNYYKDVTDKQLVEAMISGTPDKMGSQYTRYLTKSEVDRFRESIKGEYYGIGANVQLMKDGKGILITNVHQDSPAEKAGLKADDIVIRVNGKNVSEFSSIEAVVSEVKGKKGSTVTLTVERKVDNKPVIKDYTIERGPVEIKVVSHELVPETEGKNIGYIRVREFTENLPEQFIPSLKYMVDHGRKNIILDMRFNPGGDADAMIKCLSAILPKVKVATIKGRSGGKNFQEDWETDGKQIFPNDLYFYILVNSNTASAAEFFSGALHDLGRATIIGTQTFGKGVATQTFPLKDGSALNVTTFEYYLPKGESINQIGLTPDVPVEQDKEYATADPYQIPVEKDALLQKAIELISAKTK